MRSLFCTFLVAFLFLLSASGTKEFSPMVQVYSRRPGELGKGNILICHVSGFHPPLITVELLKNGEKMEDTKQTDLAFEENWQYHLTEYVPFTPNKGEQYACRVTHMGIPKMFSWESDV